MLPNRKDIVRKANRFLLPLIAFCIPVHDKAVAFAIVLLGLSWLTEMDLGGKLRLLRLYSRRRQVLLFALLYLVYVAGTFYSENLFGGEGAFFDLEIKLSLLIFPLIISTLPLGITEEITLYHVMIAFIAGCLVSALMLISVALLHYYDGSGINVFFYTGLSGNHHPSYIALFYSFAVVLLIYLYLSEKEMSLNKKSLLLLAILILTEMIVLLSSKAGIIGMVIALVILFLWQLTLKRSHKPRNLVFIGIVGMVFGIMNLLSPQSYQRFFEAGKVIESHDQVNKAADASSEVRILIWQAAFEIIREHPFAGTGTGDVKLSLREKYKKYGYQHALESNLNAHNQYLQTYIATGLAGFVLLVMGLAIPISMSIVRREPVYFAFIILTGFHLLVESMLERQAGVVFYAFFNALLFANLASLKQDSDPELTLI